MIRASKISVIIPCFNHGEFVAEAVSSVTSIGRADLEVIVIDDGSTDDRTRKEASVLEAQGIQVVRQKNCGLAAARNAGVLASRGEYIFPLDADDRLRPGWIDRAIQILDSDPKVGVVYGDAECFGSRTGRWVVGSFDADRLLHMNYIHASALYRRSVWEQNGGYDGTMPVQGLEDWDFWVGALEHGWRFFYIPEVFFEYRQAEGSMITRARGHAAAVEEFVARKHGPMYRQAWLSLEDRFSALQNERQSVKRTARDLRRLLGVRLKQRLTDAGFSRNMK